MKYVLDLHGVKHENVARKCNEFMSKIWGKTELAEIITGNSQKMRREVFNALHDYDVEVRVAIRNPAILLVNLD